VPRTTSAVITGRAVTANDAVLSLRVTAPAAASVSAPSSGFGVGAADDVEGEGLTVCVDGRLLVETLGTCVPPGKKRPSGQSASQSKQVGQGTANGHDRLSVTTVMEHQP
jgi:hypothetical protein